jgi:hypothetical protein
LALFDMVTLKTCEIVRLLNVMFSSSSREREQNRVIFCAGFDGPINLSKSTITLPRSVDRDTR